MSKIVAFPAPKAEANAFWTIIIEEGQEESRWATWNDEKRQWVCGIITYSFDRLPALKEQVLQQIKIQQAVNGGCQA